MPIWALNPERVEVRTPPAGDGEVDLIMPFTGTTPVSVDGRRLPAGFPVRGINPEAVASLEMAGDHMMVRLKSEPEFRAGQGGPGQAGDVAEATARAAANAETRARYERASAADYRTYCASGSPGDDGFCAGVMLGQLMQASVNGLCVPEELAADPARSTEFVARGKLEVARMAPRPGESAVAFAGRALRAAYPCDAASAGESVPLSVQVQLDGRPIMLSPDQELRVEITGENGEPKSRYLARSDGATLATLAMALSAGDFPRIGEGNRAYKLTGEIRHADGRVIYRADALTLRIAPGRRGAMPSPVLTFRPV